MKSLQWIILVIIISAKQAYSIDSYEFPVEWATNYERANLVLTQAWLKGDNYLSKNDLVLKVTECLKGSTPNNWPKIKNVTGIYTEGDFQIYFARISSNRSQNCSVSFTVNRKDFRKLESFVNYIKLEINTNSRKIIPPVSKTISR